MQGRFLSLIPLALTLCACGDSGDGEANPTPVAFTSFANVQPGQAVTMNGQSQTQFVTQNPSSGVVTQQAMNLPDPNGVSATLTYAPVSPLLLTGIQFLTPRVGTVWNNGSGGQAVTCGSQFCSASGDGAVGVLVNALGSLAWNFQTFGYWLTVTGQPANIAANISAGNPAPISGIPVSGNATYSGVSGGLYISPAGSLEEHKAVMSAVVNFDPVARTVDFSTTVTTTRAWNSGATAVLETALNISGQLTYAAGTNRFTGQVNMGPVGTPTLSGFATGVFYGPNAEEMGGTFFLTSNFGAIESITGSFGGKR